MVTTAKRGGGQDDGADGFARGRDVTVDAITVADSNVAGDVDMNVVAVAVIVAITSAGVVTDCGAC
jgi:hypothetical protein